MRYNVLVINGGRPFQILPWQKIVKTIFNYDSKIYVLEEYKNFPLHAGGGVEIMKCPSVVTLKGYVRFIPPPKYSKRQVFYRDNYRCQYCGEVIKNSNEREIDHVIPRADVDCPGSVFENVVLSCTRCNQQKSNKTIEQMSQEFCWNGKPFKLIKKPDVPEKTVGNISRYITMVGKHNIMWLDYLYGWEDFASKLGKDWLFDEYDKYIRNKDA